MLYESNIFFKITASIDWYRLFIENIYIMSV